jgi:cob(I)alamin adenosyltransferase
MVKLNKIYTRTGDGGDTGLADGSRRRKDDARLNAIGAVDEANAAIGLARLHSHGELDALLARVQNALFDLGADLATPGEPEGWTPLRVRADQVEALEAALDRYNEALAPLDSFILPAGTALAAHMHMARTLVRRAEREAVALAASEKINTEAVRYLNRLSDLLFVLARHANEDGRADVKWVPGL